MAIANQNEFPRNLCEFWLQGGHIESAFPPSLTLVAEPFREAERNPISHASTRPVSNRRA